MCHYVSGELLDTMPLDSYPFWSSSSRRVTIPAPPVLIFSLHLSLACGLHCAARLHFPARLRFYTLSLLNNLFVSHLCFLYIFTQAQLCAACTIGVLGYKLDGFKFSFPFLSLSMYYGRASILGRKRVESFYCVDNLKGNHVVL